MIAYLLDGATHRIFFLMLPRSSRSTLFPSRRSSDLHHQHTGEEVLEVVDAEARHREGGREARADEPPEDDGLAQGADEDRKSTRLNSSHSQISYAVFCLKKKKSSESDRRSP